MTENNTKATPLEDVSQLVEPFTALHLLFMSLAALCIFKLDYMASWEIRS